MKGLILLIKMVFLCLAATIVSSCSPSLEEVEKLVYEGVEELLTEDNDEESSLEMKEFTLDTKVDDLTYTGFLKAELISDEISGVHVDRHFDLQYSYEKTKSKILYDVKIKFLDKSYEKYTINLEPK